jgi:UDP-N-acetylglucosamine acyltransferase
MNHLTIKSIIHPSAIIHPEAKIADNVTIDQFVTVDRNVEIGAGTHIFPQASILEGSRIGKNCSIFQGAVVGAIPQDLKFKGEETEVIIGDNTTLREYVTVNRGTVAKNKTVVENDCLIMAYCHIAHDCLMGNNEGGSRISKDVPPYVLAGHDPLSYAAVKSLSEGLCAELSDTNVQILVAFPGAMNTDIKKNSGMGDRTDYDKEKAGSVLQPRRAAEIIISGMERNKKRVFVGNDSKTMNLLYRISPDFAVKLIYKKIQHKF